jgi:adenylate kinase family enzyme
VGKSSIAEELAKHYKLHHIKIKDVISEAIAKLVMLATTLLGILIFKKHFSLSCQNRATNRTCQRDLLL